MPPSSYPKPVPNQPEYTSIGTGTLGSRQTRRRPAQYSPIMRTLRSSLHLLALPIALASCAHTLPSADATTPTPPPKPTPNAVRADGSALRDEYQLYWADEFNGTSLDESKWGFWLQGKYRDGFNSRDAVSVADGVLSITISKQPRLNAQGVREDRFLSAMLTTERKFETTYGYFEARLKFQTQPGFWSAFWINTPTMGKPTHDPARSGVEIDIIEYLATPTYRNRALHTIHWDAKTPHHQRDHTNIPIKGFGESWHTVAAEWTPTEIVFFVDGKETWRTTKAISKRPQYLVLSCEIGDWAGDIRTATLPDRFQADYVRVYKRNKSDARAAAADESPRLQPPEPNALRAYFTRHPNDRIDAAAPWNPAAPVTKADAQRYRDAMWQAYAAAPGPMQSALKSMVEAGAITVGNASMPYVLQQRGPLPPRGWPTTISLHGGGNVAKDINDRQWQNQQGRYQPDGVAIFPRAAIDGPGLWHAAHNYDLFDRLVRAAILFHKADPDRIYLMGYSEGGYGANRLAPNMADRFAAFSVAAAGEMLDRAPAENLRNLPMNLQVGEKDPGFDRIGLARTWAERLRSLAANDPFPQDSPYQIEFVEHPGKGHAIDDRSSTAWMLARVRNPVPRRIVWTQSGPAQTHRYWLKLDQPIPHGTQPAWENRPQSIDARVDGQTITLDVRGGLPSVTVRLDDRLLDLDKPVSIVVNGSQAFSGMIARSLKTLAQTLEERGDPKLMFSAEVTVQVPASPPLPADQAEAQAVRDALTRAGPNAAEFESALAQLSGEERESLWFLIRTMPDRDLRELKADLLLSNVRLAHRAWKESPWGSTISQAHFRQYILPLAHLNEKREDWRTGFFERFREKAWSFRDPIEATKWLNDTLNNTLNVHYHATKRPKPDQSPSESIAAGYASCTGLSILLADVCRAVGIPARIVGVPLWTKIEGNHNWVEVWGGPIEGDRFVRRWYNVGGTGSDPRDGDWVNERCREQTDPDKPEHMVYAAVTRQADRHFPLVWDRSITYVPAHNVTRFYKTPVDVAPPLGTDASAEIWWNGELVAFVRGDIKVPLAAGERFVVRRRDASGAWITSDLNP